MAKKKDNYLSPISRKRRKGRQDTARCYLYQDGKRTEIHLGVFGSPEAQELYNQIAAQFYQGDQTIAPVSRQTATMAYLFDNYLTALESKLATADDRRRKTERSHCFTVIRYVMELFADLPLSEFNCSTYRRIRDYFVALAPKVESVEEVGVGGKTWKRPVKKPWSKNYVNKLMNYFRQILHWGVAHDLVEYSVVEKLKYVEPLTAPHLTELEPRQDVPDEVIKATLPYLTTVVRDMVVIQRGNGLRPSEVCNMQVKDIQWENGACCMIKKGKTTWKTGIPLIVFFSQAEVEIIERRIAGKEPEDYLFTPEESERERQEKRKEQRATKRTPRDYADLERARQNPKKFKPCYDASSYYRSIQFAINQANKNGDFIPHWTPYQIRHTAVTQLAYAQDRQTAAFLAGHTSVATTNRYAHEMVKVKADLARERERYI